MFIRDTSLSAKGLRWESKTSRILPKAKFLMFLTGVTRAKKHWETFRKHSQDAYMALNRVKLQKMVKKLGFSDFVRSDPPENRDFKNWKWPTEANIGRMGLKKKSPPQILMKNRFTQFKSASEKVKWVSQKIFFEKTSQK